MSVHPTYFLVIKFQVTVLRQSQNFFLYQLLINYDLSFDFLNIYKNTVICIEQMCNCTKFFISVMIKLNYKICSIPLGALYISYFSFWKSKGKWIKKWLPLHYALSNFIKQLSLRFISWLDLMSPFSGCCLFELFIKIVLIFPFSSCML